LQPLAEVFGDPDAPAERSMATNMLVAYAPDQPDVLAELIKDADAGQYAKLFPLLQAHREKAVALLRQELEKKAPSEERVAARDVLARRQARAAVALFKLGETEPLWPLLRHSDDPSRRTYLLHDLGWPGTEPGPILRRLETETDVTARRALILSLGEFTAERLPEDQRKPVVARLLDWYRNDPDPGIHAAVDWLLRHRQQGKAARKLDWQQREALLRIDRDMAGQPADQRRWYVNKEGQTMALVPGPVEFLIGSSPYDRDRSVNEPRHPERIPRSYAIATKEVTVAQFQRFLEANPQIKRKYNPERLYNPDSDAPALSVTWFDATQYCNWLSKQENIPKEQWCYPAIEQIDEGMELPRDYLHLTGYRLPTEAEWEHACRAGSRTSRFYGSGEAMLKEYAWYVKNTDAECTWPVGQLKPNDLGLFDVYGNAYEWCQDRSREEKPMDQGLVREDREDTMLKVSNAQDRLIRGGSFVNQAWRLHSAAREGALPSTRSYTVGFRVAKTYR
jgi:formylglycine-generating enzyme required for sulfatase activity